MASVEAPALELLQRGIVGQLGFRGLDGYPRVLPVWFEYRDGEILIASPKGAYKCRSITADGRASLAVSTSEAQPYHLVTAVGDAAVELLPEAERLRFVGAQAERYLGPERGRAYLERWSQGGHPGDGELIRIRPRRIRFSLV
jgi:nitroimidazol reductase NimA-like FMN-containing flavoprotein (pyridoxamine 5'-phosphate oxidase superfamily)